MTLLPIVATYLDWLEKYAHDGVIRWACPVPYFGNAQNARVATVGINPSCAEFADRHGNELMDRDRRLPTLRSLALPKWRDADSRHISEIIAGCDNYFLIRPYDRWFGRLESLGQPAGWTYYGQEATMCHIDLVAYATKLKWSRIDTYQREYLLGENVRLLSLTIRHLPIECLVLNGRAVLRAFQHMTGGVLVGERMPEWDLPRWSRDVKGYAYSGTVSEFAGIELGREVRVFGYNHNIQSSFGVTKEVASSIGRWLASRLEARR